MLDLTAKQLKRAAAIKARIDALSRELSKLLDGLFSVLGGNSKAWIIKRDLV